MLSIPCTFYYNWWTGYEDTLFGNWVIQNPSYQTVKRMEWRNFLGTDRLLLISVIFGNTHSYYYSRRSVLRESRVVKRGAGSISESSTALSIRGVSDSEPVCALKSDTSNINCDRWTQQNRSFSPNVLAIHWLTSNRTDLRYTICLINHFTNIEDIGRNISVLLYRGHSVYAFYCFVTRFLNHPISKQYIFITGSSIVIKFAGYG